MDDPMGDIADRIEAAIAASIQAGELGVDKAGMPGGFVLVATYYDSEGTMCTALTANPGARVHETLGLLALGKVAWESEALDWVRGD